MRPARRLATAFGVFLLAGCAVAQGPGAKGYGVEQEDILGALARGEGPSVLSYHEERDFVFVLPGPVAPR